MTTFHVVTEGNWSGGGSAVLQNFEFAAARHPRLCFSGGDVAVLNRNFPRRRVGRPYVLVPHNAWPWGGPKLGLKERAKLAGMRQASELAMRAAVGVIRVGRMIPAVGRVHERLLPDPLDPGFEDAIRSLDGSTSPVSHPYFASIGTLDSYRGAETVISAYAQYRSQGGRTRLLIAGNANPRYLKRLVRLADGLDGATIQGSGMDRPEYIRTLHHSRLAILPSHVEAGPFSLLESLAVQPNVAATDIPGHRDIVPPDTDHPRYFGTADPAALASLMHEVDTNPVERPRHHLADAGFRELERERWSDRLLTMLDDVTAGV